MNTGQMMITMAAMILLSTVILSVNKNTLNTTIKMSESKYEILAVSLGTALIEEAFGKSFDENTAFDPSKGTNNTAETVLDLSIEMKADKKERNRKLFDDFDDYNGYVDSTSNDSTLQSAQFTIASNVYYVDPSKSKHLKPAGYRTWHKKMDVFITSPFINDGKDTIKLSKVYSYYYFR